MSELKLHERCVEAWLAARGTSDADDGRMTNLLLAGLRALWDRARPSLGEVTLTAILQRAIHTAERRHNELAQLGLRVNERGAITITNTAAPRVELRAAVSAALVEVLRALARVTAEGLTPALHAALSSTTIDEPRALVLLRSPSVRRDSRDERGAS